jgi:general secretion pathway protein K
MPNIFQKGSALLSALFIMTLVAIAATAMSLRLQQDIYETELAIQNDTLYLASQGVVFWAMGEASSPKYPFTQINAKGQVANLPKNLQTLFPGLQVTGDVYDLQGLFNLANLQMPSTLENIAIFNRLLENVLKKPKSELDAIFYALQDWQLPYTLGKGKDEYTSYYLSQTPPYYPSHQPMRSTSEFRLLQHVNAADYMALLPFITVLPEQTLININTAPKPILMSLTKEITEAQVQEILQTRENGGLTNMIQLGPILDKLKLQQNQVATESNYFLVVASVSNQELALVNYTVIKRDVDTDGRVRAQLVSESLNTPP